MQLKPITAIAVVVLVGFSLSVAGYITSATNQTPSASATPSEALNPQGVVTHNATLEKFLAELKTQVYARFAAMNWTVQSWNQTWKNSTSASLQYTVFPNSQKTKLSSCGLYTYTIRAGRIHFGIGSEIVNVQRSIVGAQADYDSLSVYAGVPYTSYKNLVSWTTVTGTKSDFASVAASGCSAF
jgi:hypothetical protein